ncbi:MAG: hypothetical protein ACE5KT_05780 [Methanosarcinales archaeon]
MHKDFYDTTVIVAGISPTEKDKRDIQRQSSSIKVLSISKNKEVIGVTSYLNILEFIGVLSEKSNKSASFIDEKVKILEKDFGVNIIYPSYRVPINYEFSLL